MNSKLLYKYINNKATEEEIRQVLDWADENPAHKQDLKKLMAANAISQRSRRSSETAWIQVKGRISKPSLWLKIRKPLAAASVVAAVLTASLWWYSNQNTLPSTMPPTPSEVVLTTEGGTRLQLTGAASKGINSEGILPLLSATEQELAYTTQSDIPAEMHTLTVPYGKTYSVTLSDGTVVNLNAGSSLTYPSRFSESFRNVVLKGEGYFKVARNEKAPFTVSARDLNIQVLGTQFNVAAYEDEKEVRTLLTEGSVRVRSQNSDTSVTMTPGDLVTWLPASQSLTTSIGNQNYHLAWLNGDLRLEGETAAQLFRKLERHFGVTIQNEYSLLNEQHFSGSFKLSGNTPEEILTLLSFDTPFRFERNTNTIRIYPPNTTNQIQQ